MHFKNIEALLNMKNNGITPDNFRLDGIYGLRISIDFNLQELNDKEFQEFCNFIKEHSHLHELYLPDININALGAMNRLQTLCNAICKCKMLELLDLYGLIIEKLNSQYLREINNVFIACCNLKLLNLSWFPLSKLKIENMQDICEIISNLPKLNKLNLFATGFDKLTPTCFQLLCSAIKKCPQLECLTLYQKELDLLKLEDFARLCTVIAESNTIRYCNIEGIQPDYNEERWNTVKETLKKKQNLLTETRTERTQNLFYLSHQKTDTHVSNIHASVDKEELEYKTKRQRTCNPFSA